MTEPLDSFRTTFTVTQLVHNNHINDVFCAAEYMPRNEGLREAAKGDVVLVLTISESQGDGL